jgi:hypothetical protein
MFKQLIHDSKEVIVYLDLKLVLCYLWTLPLLFICALVQFCLLPIVFVLLFGRLFCLSTPYFKGKDFIVIPIGFLLIVLFLPACFIDWLQNNE